MAARPARIGPPGMRARLQRLLAAVAGAERVLILPHNDPDPDAIASALAVRHLLAEAAGIDGQLAYKGIIGRAENKALVRYLGDPLHRLADGEIDCLPIVLVDTQPGAGNNPLSPDCPVTAVLDHHPLRDETATARFADVRSDVGATSTIVTEYLCAAELEPPAPLATALFYGIQTDTLSLGRGAGPEDVAAYFYLQPLIDVEGLVRIARAQVPAEYFSHLAAALHAARVYDGVVLSYVGAVPRPDMAAEMADLLLRLEGARWTICTARFEQDLVLSVRTRLRDGAGDLAQFMVAGRGTAGGHGVMGGGQIPLRDDEDAEQMATSLGWRALEYLGVAPDTEGVPLIEGM